jgi:hypothetical protein
MTALPPRFFTLMCLAIALSIAGVGYLEPVI